MIKKVREIEINKPNGTFEDIIELYKRLGKITPSYNNFMIQVSILETREDGK